MAKLVVNVGGMFSGKTTELQRQGERHILAGHKVVFIKPSIDTRYSEDEIVTHTGHKVQALSVTTITLLEKIEELKQYAAVLFDEVQFFDGLLISVVWILLKNGVDVYASGLDMDYKADGFMTTLGLMAIADEVHKFQAVCECCGADAVVTGTRVEEEIEGSVKLGAKETYIPLCRECFFEHGGKE